MDSFMSDVNKKLRQNEYKEVKPSSTSSVWASFMQIVDKDNKKVSAVKCITCDALLKFDLAKTGTLHLLKHTRSCGKNVMTQTSMASFIRLGVVPKKARDVIAEKCTKVCAKDLRAFSMFETPTFIELAQTILDTGSTHGRCNVKDLLPSGVTLSRLTQRKYESLRAEFLPTIKKAIAEGLACGASTDMWTDDHRKVSYNCITLHYIGDNWEFNSRIICTCAFPLGAKKTALNLKTELLKQLGEFGLTLDEIDRLVFVSDQAANVQATLSQRVHKSCLAHTLNTVLKHTFKKSNEGDEEEDGNEEELQQVRACIEQCKTPTTFFTNYGLQLRLKQCLKQECETRWNTKLEMVKSVLNAFDDIQSTLFERGEMHRMSHISKDILQMLIYFLQPFKQATEELSGSKYCTINLVALWKSTLLTHCQFSQDDPLPLRITKHRCMGLIVLLWPKFKQLRMFTPEEKEEIYESARRELASLPKRAATTEVNAQQNQVEYTEMARSVPPPGPVPLFSQWADIENAELDTGLVELEQYLQHKPTMKNDRDILRFWKHT
ncbi:Transposable element Hobo transposase [Labeo rohita]|uniref:Transposable element Hobo transposase n=1 Tax=Labeo rohita TaxID=84645 RepID=A0ABQ8L256_LABRO|nr:Transposable element Hobo transposase [Labeo rohita]